MLKCSICGKQHKTTLERAQCEINCAKQAEAEAEALKKQIDVNAEPAIDTRLAAYDEYIAIRETERQAIINLYKQQCVAIHEYCAKHDTKAIDISQSDANVMTISFKDDDGVASYSFVTNPEYLELLMEKHISSESELKLVDNVSATDDDTETVRSDVKNFCAHLNKL